MTLQVTMDAICAACACVSIGVFDTPQFHNIQYCPADIAIFNTTGPRIGHTINSLASYGMGKECTIPLVRTRQNRIDRHGAP